MVAYSFKEKFAPEVQAGTKTQTIRQTARCKVGDRLQLYTGLRTKKCRKLREGICCAIDTVSITPEGPVFGQPGWHPKDPDDFAAKDGFRCYDDMYDFFHDEYGEEVFNGFVIMWNPI